MPVANQSTSHSNDCLRGHERYRQRRAADVLTSREVDALVLQAAIAGLDGPSIRAFMAAQREAAAHDGTVCDERGELRGWPYG